MSGVKRQLKALTLSHISAVTYPCQEGAQAKILKAAPGATILKYCGDEPGAKSFATLLADKEEREKIWQAQQELWPVFDALSESIRSTLADANLTSDAKQSMIRQSVTDFLETIRAKSPEVEAELAKHLATIEKEGSEMSKIFKTLDEATAEIEKKDTEIADLTKSVETLTAERDAAVAKADEMEKAKDKAETDLEDMKKRADAAGTDEVIKVAGQEVRKSVVGDAHFAIFKAQADEMAKARDDAATARFEKRATEEFPSLVGTAAEKASVLKAIAGAGEEVVKAADAILTSAEKLAKAAFEKNGTSGGDAPEGQVTKAAFDAKVDEIQKRDGSSRQVAMQKARVELPGYAEGTA